MMPDIDFESLTLNELQELLGKAQEELSSRTLVEQYSARIDQVIRDYAAATGRDLEEGVEWEEPKQVVDAYPKEQIVKCEHDNLHRSMLAANREHPCENEAAWPIVTD